MADRGGLAGWTQAIELEVLDELETIKVLAYTPDDGEPLAAVVDGSTEPETLEMQSTVPAGALVTAELVPYYGEVVRYVGDTTYPGWNMVPNPSFRRGSDGSIAQWSVQTTGSGQVQHVLWPHTLQIRQSELEAIVPDQRFVLQSDPLPDQILRCSFAADSGGNRRPGSVVFTSAPFDVESGMGGGDETPIPYTLMLHLWSPISEEDLISITVQVLNSSDVPIYTFQVGAPNPSTRLSPTNLDVVRPLATSAESVYRSGAIGQGLKRWVCSGNIHFTADTTIRLRITVNAGQRQKHGVTSLYLLSVVFTPTINFHLYERSLASRTPVVYEPPLAGVIERGVRPGFWDFPHHALTGRQPYGLWDQRPGVVIREERVVRLMGGSSVYSLPVSAPGGASSQWNVAYYLKQDPTSYHTEVVRAIPSPYTGGYRSFEAAVLENQVLGSLTVPDTPNGVPVRVGFYTDPFPVVKGAFYILGDTFRLYIVSSPQNMRVEQMWWYSELSRRMDLSRVRPDYRCFRIVVQGLDVNNRVCELALVSPIAQQENIIDHEGQTPVLVSIDFRTNRLMTSQPFRFLRPETVKARVGIEFLQVYQKPAGGGQPVLLVPPPISDLDISSAFGANDRSNQRRDRQPLVLVGLPQAQVFSTDLLTSMENPKPDLSSGWVDFSQRRSNALPFTMIKGSSGIYEKVYNAIASRYVSEGGVYRIHSVWAPDGERRYRALVYMEVTVPFRPGAVQNVLALQCNMRINPSGASYIGFEWSDTHPERFQRLDARIQDISAVVYLWDSDNMAAPVQIITVPQTLSPIQAATFSDPLFHGVDWRNRNAVGNWVNRDLMPLVVIPTTPDNQQADMITVCLWVYGKTQQIWPSDRTVDANAYPLYEVSRFQLKHITPSADVIAEVRTRVLLYTRAEHIGLSDWAPYLAGAARTQSGRHYPRVLPGTTLRIERYDVQQWRRQANGRYGALARAVLDTFPDRVNRGDRFLLGYTVPAGAVRLVTASVDAGQSGHVPLVEVVEKVAVVDGTVRLREPAYQVVRWLRYDGSVVGPVDQPSVPTTVLSVPESCRWDPWITVYYRTPSDAYFYSGYITSNGGFCSLLLRTDKRCVIDYEDQRGMVRTVDNAWRALDRGISLILQPYLAVPYDSGIGWEQLLSRAVLLRPDLRGVQRLLQHRLGILAPGEGDSPLALPVGYILGRSRLAVTAPMVIDLRRHGGGWQNAEQLDITIRDALWDVSDWDGSLRGGAGHVLVKLPSYLLDSNHPYGGYSIDDIRRIVRRYLPAGITFDVEFYETSGGTR